MKKIFKKQHPIDQLQRVYIYCKRRSLKTQILNSFCEEYKLHRKSVIRRLNRVDKPKKKGSSDKCVGNLAKDESLWHKSTFNKVGYSHAGYSAVHTTFGSFQALAGYGINPRPR